MGLPCLLQIEPDIYARLRMYLAVESLWYLGQVWHIAALLNSQLDTVDRKLTEYSRWLLTCEACTAIGVGAAFQLHRGLGHTEWQISNINDLQARRSETWLWPSMTPSRQRARRRACLGSQWNAWATSTCAYWADQLIAWGCEANWIAKQHSMIHAELQIGRFRML